MDRNLFIARELDRADRALDEQRYDVVRALHEKIRRALNDESPDYLTTQDAADLLGFRSINTVKALIKTGAIAGERTSERGHYRIPRQSVEAFMRSPRFAQWQEDERDRMIAEGYSVPDEDMPEAVAELHRERQAAGG